MPAILDRLADSVEWEYGAGASEIPWLQARRGRAGAAEFFSTLSALEIEKFVPKSFFEGPGLVVVLLDLRGDGQGHRQANLGGGLWPHLVFRREEPGGPFPPSS